MITQVFVYGTLQRNQCRGNLWPREPLHIHWGYVRGRLYDLGDYPALRSDDEDLDSDWIQGEIWTFDPADIEETLQELDIIEETNQPGLPNLYDRCLVRAFGSLAATDSVLAWAYQYSNASALTSALRVKSGRQGYAAWPSTESGDRNSIR